jgi:predicted transcriptional regulator
VGSLVNDEELSGIEGLTSDFTASKVRAFIVFDESVTEQRLTQLLNFQGDLKGVVQCKRVRVGSTPMSPNIKVGVLAEHCIIKSINH